MIQSASGLCAEGKRLTHGGQIQKFSSRHVTQRTGKRKANNFRKKLFINIAKADIALCYNSTTYDEWRSKRNLRKTRWGS